MSKLDKMSILGIRSFDNRQAQYIQFYTPLTLIVGSNGCGKTTIIECLKYATTGDQPPNTKGGAFIHDPKLCGEREVLAQVKLKFQSTSGAEMTVTRSLKLEVKKAARSMKTLEGSLAMSKAGERMVVSSRVAELDQVLPQYLGASKAILDNVVFCHQDESLWPLSEPATLKKKFDEIFEAQKYTKAIDNIKVLRKNQVESLGKLKIREEAEKQNKDRAEKADKRSRELDAEIADLRAGVEEIREQLEEAARKAEDAWEQASSFGRIVNQLESKQTEARIKEESIKDARADLEEMSESDDALQTMLDQQDERSRTYEKEIGTKTKAYEHVTSRATEAQNELGRKQRDHGKYQAEHAQYERQLEQRTTLVKETAARHKIPGFDYDLDDVRIRDFASRISNLAKDQERSRKRAYDESQQEIGEAQNVLGKLNGDKSGFNSSRETAKEQIRILDRKIQTQQATLDRLDIDEGAQARLQSSIADTRDTLQNLKSNAERADWSKQIDEAEASLRELEAKREELDSEVHRATKNAKQTAEIDHLRKSMRSTDESLTSVKGAHGEELEKLLGTSWDKTLEQNYDDICKARATALTDAEHRRDRCQSELDAVDTKLKTVRDDHSKKVKEVKKCEKTLIDTLGEGEEIREFNKIVEDLEASRNELEYDDALVGFHDKARAYFQKHHACKLCDRPFPKDDKAEALQKKFRQYLDKESKERQVELKEVNANLESMKQATPAYLTWLRLTDTDIPALASEDQGLQAARQKVLDKLEREHERRITECKDAKYEAEKPSKSVKSIVKYANDLQSLKKQIDELTNKHSQSGVVMRSLDDISEQQKKITEQSKAAKSNLGRLRSDRETAQDRINQLELEMRDVQAKLNQAASQLKDKQNLQSQIDELISSKNEQRENMDKVDKKLQALAPKIRSAQEKYDDLQRRAEERQSQLTAEANKTQNSVNQLQSAQREITSYLDRHGPQQLAKAEREIASIKDEQSSIDKEKVKLTKEINKLRTEQRDHAEVIKGIQRNLKYRRDTRAVERLHSEIAELETQNAHSDRDHHTRQASKWQNKRNELSAQQSSLVGQVKSKDEILTGLIADWTTDYKDAAAKFQRAVVEVTATKAVIDDLGRYGGALDKAIMRYHSLKMDEINALIEELWQKTYKGTDVDSILIRSDNDSGKGNKSYNYRVCMVKQDVEMDMRGRCSAGQKVLASIIIRLALAECFGVSCGIIALDEPTTNLDYDNIISLAQSLHEIIVQRQAQSNFQLIVITHDEEFLRHMKCSDFSDHYFRVSRDSNQKSKIAIQSIGQVS